MREVTIDELIKFLDSKNDESMELLKKKGHDYAGKDIFQNFKQMFDLCNTLKIDFTKPESIHMFYIILKIQRICNLIFTDKKPSNESIEDTLIDLTNYVNLFHARIKLEKHEQA